MLRRLPLLAALLLAPLVPVHAPGTVAPSLAPVAASTERHTFERISYESDWNAGTWHGAAPYRGTLYLTAPQTRLTVGGRAYERGDWTSPWISPGHSFTEVLPSWDVATPEGHGLFVTVRVQVRTPSGTASTWKSMGRWAEATNPLLRRSAGSQADAVASVATDTVRARPGVTLSSYRLRVELYRPEKETRSPAVHSLHAVASRLSGTLPRTSPRYLSAHTELRVPPYSQMVHRGHYPEYGGGGVAWCSPTSVAMVLAYYGVKPSESQYAWVSDPHTDPWVDEVARRVYDFEYEGTGNWPFNTAYAAKKLHRAVVMRLRGLHDAERFVAKGVPVVASISFGSGQLAGAPLTSTPGHLVVIRGFNKRGDVIVNDPAAPDSSTVRRVYDRAQFEAAWLRRSHGLAYLLRDGKRFFPSGYVGG